MNKSFIVFVFFVILFHFHIVNAKEINNISSFSIEKLLTIKNINKQISIIEKIKQRSFNLDLYLAKLYIKKREFNKAKKILRKLMKISNSPYIYELYYEIYNDNKEKQLLILQEGLNNSNKYDKKLNYLIIKTAKDLGKNKMAIFYALKYLKMYPGDKKINLELEKLFLSEGKLKTAKAILYNLLLYYPNDKEIKEELEKIDLF